MFLYQGIFRRKFLVQTELTLLANNSVWTRNFLGKTLWILGIFPKLIPRTIRLQCNRISEKITFQGTESNKNESYPYNISVVSPKDQINFISVTIFDIALTHNTLWLFVFIICLFAF
jgi:hypothetical protein